VSVPLKTVHIETGRHLYGGGLQVIYLAKGLMDRGHEATLICCSGSAIEKEAERRGIPVRPIRMLSEADPAAMLRMLRAIKKLQPDVVHLHSRRGADLLGGIAARLARVPVIILSRRVDDRVRLDLIGRLKHLVLPHRLVAISDGIRRVLIDCGVPAERVELVHSGVVTSEFRCERDREWLRGEFGIETNAPVIGTIAQLIERKGHRFLFEAAVDILKEFPDTKFLVLGTGEECDPLDELVKGIGIAESVVFAGFRQDIAKIIPNLDIVLHPALREGLGVSLLQAASSGVAIVGTNAGGIPEIVRNEETGILIEPGDSLAIADACLRLLRDAGLRERFGEVARELVEREFSTEQMIEGNLRVYRETLSGAKHSRRQEVAQ
jgi:glycosyltransferase involved in cell wall biosynthesis